MEMMVGISGSTLNPGRGGVMMTRRTVLWIISLVGVLAVVGV